MALTKLNFSGSQTALVAGNIPTLATSNMPTGSVIQTVSAITTTGSGAVTTTTAILTGSITPTSTSSKIYITAHGSCSVICGSSGILNSHIHRGGISDTAITRFYSGLGAGVTSGHEHYINVDHAVLDSPSTTSSQTYTLSITKGSGGTTSVKFIGTAGHPMVMTLMEIAG